MAKYDSLINDAKRAKGIPINEPLNGRFHVKDEDYLAVSFKTPIFENV